MSENFSGGPEGQNKIDKEAGEERGKKWKEVFGHDRSAQGVVAYGHGRATIDEKKGEVTVATLEGFGSVPPARFHPIVKNFGGRLDPSFQVLVPGNEDQKAYIDWLIETRKSEEAEDAVAIKRVQDAFARIGIKAFEPYSPARGLFRIEEWVPAELVPNISEFGSSYGGGWSSAVHPVTSDGRRKISIIIRDGVIDGEDKFGDFLK